MAEAMEKRTCQKCNRFLNIDQFYRSRNLEAYPPEGYLPVCKKCFTMHLNNWEPSSITPLLEIMDVPYIPEEWEALLQRYGQDPKKTTQTAIFGRYLSKMKLKQFSEYRFADSERILEEREKQKQIAAARDESYRLRYAAIQDGNVLDKVNADISLLSDDEILELFPQVEYQQQLQQGFLGAQQFQQVPQEPSVEDQIPIEDKMKLSIKWGKTYTVNEWLTMERMYRDMLESYEIKTASHLDYLKMICKTSLKMNQSIDVNDFEGYNKLAKVYDSLMKSAKFTAAQNKTESENEFQAVSELILMAEEEGFIPRFDVSVPQDIIDATMRDMERYLNTLVREEQGLGNLIEVAISQMKREEEANAELEAALEGESFVEEDLTDEDYIDFYEFQEEDDEE